MQQRRSHPLSHRLVIQFSHIMQIENSDSFDRPTSHNPLPHLELPKTQTTISRIFLVVYGSYTKQTLNDTAH
jgi:hypothetical protein